MEQFDEDKIRCVWQRVQSGEAYRPPEPLSPALLAQEAGYLSQRYLQLSRRYYGPEQRQLQQMARQLQNQSRVLQRMVRKK